MKRYPQAVIVFCMTYRCADAAGIDRSAVARLSPVNLLAARKRRYLSPPASHGDKNPNQSIQATHKKYSPQMIRCDSGLCNLQEGRAHRPWSPCPSGRHPSKLWSDSVILSKETSQIERTEPTDLNIVTFGILSQSAND